MKSFVYSITNLKNNKSYIGKSNDPTKRLIQHYRAKTYIGEALRKTRKDLVLFQIIEECATEKEAYEAERFYIQYFGTIKPFGYNISSGYNAKEHHIKSWWDEHLEALFDSI
jgi:group I intron endonuclease